MQDGSEFMLGLLIEQRRRLVATVMGTLEREVYPKLEPREQRDLRTSVLQAIDTYTDLVRDILKVSRDDMVRNELAVELIRDIHTGNQRILERLDG